MGLADSFLDDCYALCVSNYHGQCLAVSQCGLAAASSTVNCRTKWRPRSHRDMFRRRYIKLIRYPVLQ
jgi:hypothetical protein